MERGVRHGPMRGLGKWEGCPALQEIIKLSEVGDEGITRRSNFHRLGVLRRGRLLERSPLSSLFVVSFSPGEGRIKIFAKGFWCWAVGDDLISPSAHVTFNLAGLSPAGVRMETKG